MKTIKLGIPGEWQVCDERENLAFDAGENRRMNILLNAPEEVVIWLQMEDERHFLAAEKGNFNLQFTAFGKCQLAFSGPVNVKTTARSQKVTPSGDDPFTVLAPQKRQSSDMEKIAHLLNLNEQNRQAEYAAQMQRMEERIARAEKQSAPPQGGQKETPKAKEDVSTPVKKDEEQS